jgi:hypothetical protein
MYLLNELNKNDWVYEIFTKEYHWFHSEDTAYKAKGSGECLGIRIVVKLNDRYKVSIIQAFNEAIGEFYGDDVYDIAFIDTVGDGWELMPVFYMGEPDLWSTNSICNGEACIKYIKDFLKKEKMEYNNTECLKHILKLMEES